MKQTKQQKKVLKELSAAREGLKVADNVLKTLQWALRSTRTKADFLALIQSK
jgi:hypothetical protein